MNLRWYGCLGAGLIVIGKLLHDLGDLLAESLEGEVLLGSFTLDRSKGLHQRREAVVVIVGTLRSGLGVIHAMVPIGLCSVAVAIPFRVGIDPVLFELIPCGGCAVRMFFSVILKFLLEEFGVLDNIYCSIDDLMVAEGPVGGHSEDLLLLDVIE